MSIKNLFQDIADAIREASGNADLYTPSEMPDAIRNISGGGDVPLIPTTNIVNSGTENVTKGYTVSLADYNQLVILKQSKATASNSYSYNLNGRKPLYTGNSKNYGSYAFYIGEFNSITEVTSNSTGANWNNQSVFISIYPFTFNSMIENHYEANRVTAYSYTHTASKTETLYAYISKGGSGSYNPTISTTGTIEIVSTYSGAGARGNTLYKIELESGESVSISADSDGTSSRDFLFLLWE